MQSGTPCSHRCRHRSASTSPFLRRRRDAMAAGAAEQHSTRRGHLFLHAALDVQGEG